MIGTLGCVCNFIRDMERLCVTSAVNTLLFRYTIAKPDFPWMESGEGLQLLESGNRQELTAINAGE